jgi:hypothetical protein
MIGGLLASRTSLDQPQQAMHCSHKWVLEGLGLQVGVLMMSSKWNVDDMTANLCAKY